MSEEVRLYKENEDLSRLAPGWKNPPSVKQLKDDINEAMSAHNMHVEKVDKALEALRGQVRIRTQEGRSKVQPKLIRRQNEWRYSSLEEPFLSTDAMFRVNPVTSDDVEAARQNELILNKQFRTDIPKVPFINKYIRTAVNTGSVVMKMAWEEQYGTVREEFIVPDFAESPEEFIAAAQTLIQAGELDEPTMQEMLQSGEWMEVPIGEHPETHTVNKKYINRPVVEIRDSRQVIIDPSCQGDINKAQFIVDRFSTDLSSLKKDGRYDEIQLGKIEEKEFDPRTSDDLNAESGGVNTFAFKDKPRQKLVVHEYWGFWDIHDDGIVVPIVATWVGNVMIRLAENPYPDKKLPFVIVQYLPPDTDSIYGDPDASLLEDSQAIMGAVMRSIIDIIGRSASAQQGISKGLLDPNQMKNFKELRDFEFNAIQGGIENALYMAKMPELPRSAMEVINLVNMEAESLSGVRGFQEGVGSINPTSTATGVRSAMDATAVREAGILRRLANGLKEVGKKIIAMNSVWLDDEEIVRITDIDKTGEFIAIKRDDLAGNFDLSLEISTAAADNQKAEELAFMLQTIGPAVPFDIVKIIMVKIAELRKLPDLAYALKQYEPQPDPLEAALKQAQIDQIKAETQKGITTADKNKADEILKLAKAEEAGAKSRHTHSESDMLDLDYLQEATGTNQDRELERIITKEQAKPIKKV